MQVLYGLKDQGYHFKLKGGISLPKRYPVIQRFSEDIDIYIQPPAELKLNETSIKATHVGKREDY